MRCNTCDGFPCRLGAKGDAETRLIDPVLQHGDVALRTEAQVVRLRADAGGRRLVAAELLDGTEVQGDLFVLAAGARSTAPRSCFARYTRSTPTALPTRPA